MQRALRLLTAVVASPSLVCGAERDLQQALLRNRSAYPGYCGKTEAGRSNCETATRGSFKVRPADTGSWPAIARFCMQRCRSCTNCHFISFSREWEDCSWFAQCDLSSLQDQPQGFATLRSTAEVGRLRWGLFHTRDAVAQLGSSKQDNHDSPQKCKEPLLNWAEVSLLQSTGGNGAPKVQWLDVGGGAGTLGRELGRLPDLRGRVAYDCVDLVASAACPSYDGSKLAHETASRDVVSFVFVLHHAADATIGLLQHAKRVSRRYIVVVEDLRGETEKQAKMQFGHEWKGQYRGDEEWRSLFKLIGLRVVHDTPIAQTCAWGFHVPRALYVLAVS
tara:strand:+ start:1048 stop:2049 length:1002 start_codon:yes stop_codon:yes gene_type:complete